MDDRLYLAVYDEKRVKSIRVTDPAGQADYALLKKKDYVCPITVPGYEFCEAASDDRTVLGVRKARFAEIAAELYQVEEEMIPLLDAHMNPELIRHQAMAADEERLYNVWIYVREESE